MTVTLLGAQHVDLGLEAAVRLQASWPRQHLVATHVLADPAQQAADICRRPRSPALRAEAAAEALEKQARLIDKPATRRMEKAPQKGRRNGRPQGD